jgi:phosphonate transport system substrate-binding protein
MNLRLSRRALMLGSLTLLAAACGSSASKAAPTASTAAPKPATTTATTTPATTAAPKPATTPAPAPTRTLKIGAIPDSKPEKLAETNGALSAYLSDKLGVKVEYVPVTDYAAAVSQFRAGDLDLVWFGGLTGVQARLQTPGAVVLAQRDIDQDFHSVFIVNNETGIGPLASVADLAKLKGLRFTFGSESSTSGRMMPEFFLDKAGIDPKKDFSGAAGFSGSHDKTVDLVLAGTFQAGVLNEQVWKKRSTDGSVDLTKVSAVLTSPGYHDYHFIAGPDTEKRFGAGFTKKIADALLAIDTDATNGAKVLSNLGSKKFVAATPDAYGEIEAIGRKLGLIS